MLSRGGEGDVRVKKRESREEMGWGATEENVTGREDSREKRM